MTEIDVDDEIDNEELIRASTFQPGHAEAMVHNAKTGLRFIVTAVDIERKSAWLLAALPTPLLAHLTMVELSQNGALPNIPADRQYRLVITHIPDPRGLTAPPAMLRAH